MRQEILLALLARAATEPLGLIIETNNPKILRERYLGNLRKDHSDPAVRRLIFVIPSIPNTLFICQPTVELEIEPEIEL
jgi:hypothetical protein